MDTKYIGGMMKKSILIKWDEFIIEELTQDLHFTEEYLYEAVKNYRKTKDMEFLICNLKHIIKARGGK